MEDKIIITTAKELKEKLKIYAEKLSITPGSAAKVILSKELNKE